uniref:UPF0201 protein n=2 Tax=environmental samples TaxID=651140 RepID=A0A075GH58_9ARCH|nr:hypothetical protein conserved in archaea [uncultured marine thaumarchaeote KM3_163_G06]AIF15880.1 hypothetical protein conserved in archaea [uncultured marine thaumarchaeote KM3_71_H03]
MRSLDVNCKVSVFCTINASEDMEKVRTAVSNILTDMDEKITGDSLVANSNNYESLTKIYETMRSRRTKSAYRRHLMRNMAKDSTWFYLNKQAAFANVITLCDEADESPLGPIKVVLHSKNIEYVIDWLVSDAE